MNFEEDDLQSQSTAIALGYRSTMSGQSAF